jgi:hypothetical protein
MPDVIIIRDIRLPKLDSDRMTPVMRRSGHIWHVLTVTVENVSGVTPFYVMSDIRLIRFDASRRALLLQFSEHDVPVSRRSLKRPVPPRCTVVGPGEKATLTYRLSSPITFLAEAANCERKSYQIRIDEDVDTVECTVAYGTEPLDRAVDLTSRTVRDHWGAWGTNVQASWRAAPLR